MCSYTHQKFYWAEGIWGPQSRVPLKTAHGLHRPMVGNEEPDIKDIET